MASVDVIIPIYHPDEKVNRLLTALKTQTLTPERIILVHTGEVRKDEPEYEADAVIRCDENGKPMKNCPSEATKILCEIPEERFDHGGTRNLGASFSRAEVMVFMTQDAVPVDDRLLEVLVRAVTDGSAGADENDGKHFRNDAVTVAAAYARQLPNEDCWAVERYIREFNYPEGSELRTAKDIPIRGIKAFCNSNVCSAYRRDVFDRLGGFAEKTIFNEDMLFGATAILGGYGVGYAADSKVYHSHNLGLSDQFHRNFDNAVSQAEHPEVFAAVSSEKEGMKLVKYCLSRMREDGRLYLAPYFMLNCACRYAGFFLGKRFRKLPGWLVRACSLNKRYWK